MYVAHDNIKHEMFRDNKHIAGKYTGILLNNLHSVWKPNTTINLVHLGIRMD